MSVKRNRRPPKATTRVDHAIRVIVRIDLTAICLIAVAVVTSLARP